MFQGDTIVADEAGHVTHDEDRTLRHSTLAVHEHPKNTTNFSWVFAGKHAMPGAEHMIPFRT